MKRNIYKLVSGARQGLLALALVVSGTSVAQQVFTFNYTGAVQTVTLPVGNWQIECWGGNGGDVTAAPGGGGKGGYSRGELLVTNPGSLLTVYVGGRGGSANGTSAPAGNGGWNGGGGGGYCGKSAGGGGGASDVRLMGNTVADRIIVAGGGGGSAYYNQMCVGGNGGGNNGQNGDFITSGNVLTAGGGGAGATGAVPGPGGVGYPATAGLACGAGGGGNSPGGFGTAGICSGPGGNGGSLANGATGSSGGGGGGYAGGAGGTQTVNAGVGGGGGSSYIGGVNSATTIMFGQPGFVTNTDVLGNGKVVITELCTFFNFYAAANTNSLNPVICSGQSATLVSNAISNYSWSNGATTSSVVVSPTVSTVYTLTAMSPSNCITTRTINVTVSSGVPVLSISNPSNSICLGKTTSLTASGALTYTWVNPGVVNGQTFTPSSTAVYTVNGQNGCGITTATTSIQVSPLAVSTLATPTLVCQGFPATLSATSAVTGYTWQPGAQTGSAVTVAPMVNTLYTVTASDGTCTGTQTLQLITQTTPTIAASNTIASLCLGEVVTLSASGAGAGGTYSWTPGNLSGSTVTMSPSASTLITVVGTNSLGCYASAQLPAIVNQPSPLFVTANRTLVCVGGQSTLTASSSGSYSWTNGPATNTNVVSPAGPLTVYTVTGSNSSNTCTATRTIAIAVLTPSVNYTSSVSICNGETATLTASGANTYTWNGINTFSSGVYMPSPTITTQYVLVANTQSIATSCITQHTATVKVNANPVVTVAATKTTAICLGNSVTLTASGAQTYSWSNNATTASVSVSPSLTTLYTVVGTTTDNCKGTSQYNVLVSKCLGVGENSKTTLNVYPNPNNGQFTVSSEYPVNLTLMNTLGQFIRSIELNAENGYSVEVTGLAKGVYYLSADSDLKSDYMKLIVQ